MTLEANHTDTGGLRDETDGWFVGTAAPSSATW